MKMNTNFLGMPVFLVMLVVGVVLMSGCVENPWGGSAGGDYLPDQLEGIINTVRETVEGADMENTLNSVKEIVQESVSEKPSGETPSKEDQLTAYINTNLDSNIAVVVTAPNGEGLAVFTKIVDGMEFVDQIVLKSVDDKTGVIQVDEFGLPTNFTFEGYRVIFENYTEMTVDIIITKPDGTIEVLKESLLNLPGHDVVSPDLFNSVIPSASAYTPPNLMYAYMNTPEQGSTRRDIIEGGDDASYWDYITSTPGTALSVISCNIGLISILFSGALTSPFAYLGCAALGTRMATLNTEIDYCKGDIVQCGTDAILDLVRKEGPGFLRKGVRVKGQFKNSITGTPITSGTLRADSKKTKESIRGEWESDGSYEIYFKGGGAFTLKTGAEGFKDSSFDVSISSSVVRIYVPGTGEFLEENVAGEDYAEISFDLVIDPDAYIKGEVIDNRDAEPVKDVIVGLKEGGLTDFTGEDGRFWFQPLLSDRPGMVTVVAQISQCDEVTKDVFLSYEVMEYSDQYIVYKNDGLAPLNDYDPSDFSIVFKVDPPLGLAFSGKVIDFSSGKAIPGVEIEYETFFGSTKAKKSVTTSDDGAFRIPIDEPSKIMGYVDVLDIILKKEGYANQQFSYIISKDLEDPERFKIYESESGKIGAEFACELEFDPLYGLWEGRVESTGGGLDCLGADVWFKVKKGKLKGTARTDYPGLDTLRLEGDVGKDGLISGGMAKGGENTATFTGKLSTTGLGGGTWKDKYGCSGKFDVEHDPARNV